jgi:hypothetical protein
MSSLIYKAAQVVTCLREEPKAWKMEGREGVNHTALMSCIGALGGCQEIRLKAKSVEELDKKIAKYPLGKPSEIVIDQVIPTFRAGDRKASGYDLVA